MKGKTKNLVNLSRQSMENMHIMFQRYPNATAQFSGPLSTAENKQCAKARKSWHKYT